MSLLVPQHGFAKPLSTGCRLRRADGTRELTASLTRLPLAGRGRGVVIQPWRRPFFPLLSLLFSPCSAACRPKTRVVRL